MDREHRLPSRHHRGRLRRGDGHQTLFPLSALDDLLQTVASSPTATPGLSDQPVVVVADDALPGRRIRARSSSGCFGEGGTPPPTGAPHYAARQPARLGARRHHAPATDLGSGGPHRVDQVSLHGREVGGPSRRRRPRRRNRNCRISIARWACGGLCVMPADVDLQCWRSRGRDQGLNLHLARETSNRTYPRLACRTLIIHDPSLVRPDRLPRVAKINAFHVSRSRTPQKLKATPTETARCSTIRSICTAAAWQSERARPVNLPILVAGGAAGRLKGARHIKYAEPTPLANCT